MSVPIVSSSDIYKSPEDQKRLGSLLTAFEARFGLPPTFTVRSPGRVNIIGEHLDYSNFSVFPMAVERDLIMAVRVSSSGSSVVVANTDAATFAESTIALPESTQSLVDIDPRHADWANYFRCGLIVGQKYLQGHYNKELPETDLPQTPPSAALSKLASLEVLVDGNIPTGSGLSSSAAFVVCSTLVTLLANGHKNISKNLMVRLSMKCEQLVGVNTGGMDQAASVYGEWDHALYVSFFPTLSALPTAFPLPPALPAGQPDEQNKMAFVIAHTLVTSNKHETAPTNYNLRVVEVTLAALALAKALRLSAPNSIASSKTPAALNGDPLLVDLVLPPTGNLAAGTLRDVFELYKQIRPSVPDQQLLQELVSLVDSHLHDNYTFADLAALLSSSPNTSKVNAQLTTLFFTTYPVQYSTLKLRKRARHVYSEAARVSQFMRSLHLAHAPYMDTLVELGRLMDASETSLFEDFECSCPEAQALCRVVRKPRGPDGLHPLGYGSRMTGAGWGGATVHLVLQKDVPAVVQAFKEEYYRVKYPGITEKKMDEAIIISRPAAGTAILNVI